MPLKVAILFHRSLLADGIALRLREHPELVEAQMVDASSADAVERLREICPTAVIVDATDTDALRSLPITQVLDAAPGSKAMLIDPRLGDVKVYSVLRHSARAIEELIAMVRAMGAA